MDVIEQTYDDLEVETGPFAQAVGTLMDVIRNEFVAVEDGLKSLLNHPYDTVEDREELARETFPYLVRYIEQLTIGLARAKQEAGL